MKALFAALALLAAALPAHAEGGDATAGELVFKRQCAVCHSPLDGKNMMGPSLFGLIGRKAGTVAGFKYSAANQASDLVWDAEKLDPYLTNPRAVVPGTTMAYGGLKLDGQRSDLIAYLTTLK